MNHESRRKTCLAIRGFSLYFFYLCLIPFQSAFCESYLSYTAQGNKQQARDFSRAYRDLKGLWGRKKAFEPSSKAFYLGLGRSPTLITAFLQNLGEDYSASMALSGVLPVPLSPEQEKVLFDHFEKNVPTLEKLAGRKLHFFDMVWQGESGLSYLTAIKKFMRLKRKKVEYDFLILGAWEKDKVPESASRLVVQKGVRYQSLENHRAVFEVMYDQRFQEPFAPVGSFYVENKTEPSPVAVPDGFMKLRESLRSAMIQDESFLRKLKREHPASHKYLTEMEKIQIPVDCTLIHAKVGEAIN